MNGHCSYWLINLTNDDQFDYLCCNLNLGLATKARGLHGCGPRGRLGSHFTCSWECKECEGMNPHTPKWIPIVGIRVPNGLPNFHSTISGVKTHWFEDFFISSKNIETWMFKMNSHDSFGHLKYKLWSKEKLGVKVTIWLLTIKSWELPHFHKWRVTYH
jgi:hypothetical protein